MDILNKEQRKTLLIIIMNIYTQGQLGISFRGLAPSIAFLAMIYFVSGIPNIMASLKPIYCLRSMK